MYRKTEPPANFVNTVGQLVLQYPIVSLWVGGLAVSGVLTLHPEPKYHQPAAHGVTGLLMAAVATGMTKAQSGHAGAQLRKEKAALESQLRLAQSSLEDASERSLELDKVEAKLAAFQARLKVESDTYKDRIETAARRQAQAEAQKLVDAMQAKLADALAAKEAMQAEYEQKAITATQAAIEARKQRDSDVAQIGQHYTQLESAAQKAIDGRDAVLRDERQEVDRVLKRLSADIQQMTAELASWKELAIKLQAPKQFKFASYEADIGNQMQSFLNSRGVVLSCDSIGKISYGLVPYYYEAINCDLKQVEAELEAIQLHLGLSEVPKASLERGKIKLLVRLSLDETPASKADIKIVDPPLTKLERAINESIHVRIVCPSGGGKTTLLGNLINYLAISYLRDYVLSDPKVSDPKKWGNLKPHYYGLECLAHFFSLTATCLSRINEAAESVKAGDALPRFERQFHIIDELETLYGFSEISPHKAHNSKLFKINAKTMLKVGREHKLKLLFVTHSALCSELNLRRNDFENCSSIFLGSAMSEALSQTGDDGLLRDVPGEKIAQLKAEHQKRLATISKLKAEHLNRLLKVKSEAEITEDEKRIPQEFIYLFFNPAKPHDLFFGTCPPMGYYAQLAPAESVSEKSGFAGVGPRHPELGPVNEAQSYQGVQATPCQSATPAEDDASTLLIPSLETLLRAGTNCPNCGHHSASYSKRKPNSKGNVSVKCKNPECATKTFQWQVI